MLLGVSNNLLSKLSKILQMAAVGAIDNQV